MMKIRTLVLLRGCPGVVEMRNNFEKELVKGGI